MSPVVLASGGGKSTSTSPAAGRSSAAASADAKQVAAEAALKKAMSKGGRVPGATKIQRELLPPFSRQMGAMLSAGMPIVAALEAQEEQTDNPNFRAVLKQVRQSIENGSALSEALRQFPSIFDDLYCNMVRGGETGGQIAETIQRLATFLESSSKLRRKVKSAMMYPTIVLCIAFALAAAMILFIVPVFGEMFSDFGADLPAPTQFLIDISNAMKKYGIYVAFILAGVIVAFKKWKATPQGAYALDSFALKMPVFGELAIKVASGRFARSLGEMIRSGVPIMSALDIVSGATGNKVTDRIVSKMRKSVEMGEPLSSAMVTQTVFPVALTRMLQAGEKTGRIDEMMDNIADYYDDEVETMLDGLTSLLEPLLMVFLGVIIGGIVLCMFLPIFKMGEVVSG